MTETLSALHGRTGGVREQADAPARRSRGRGGERIAATVRAGADQAHRWRQEKRAAMVGPAVLLHAMIEQMGGAETSFAKGAFVRLTV